MCFGSVQDLTIMLCKYDVQMPTSSNTISCVKKSHFYTASTHNWPASQNHSLIAIKKHVSHICCRITAVFVKSCNLYTYFAVIWFHSYTWQFFNIVFFCVAGHGLKHTFSTYKTDSHSYTNYVHRHDSSIKNVQGIEQLGEGTKLNCQGHFRSFKMEWIIIIVLKKQLGDIL